MALIRIGNLPQTCEIWTPNDPGAKTATWSKAVEDVPIWVQAAASGEDISMLGMYPDATHRAFLQTDYEGSLGLRVRFVVDSHTYEQVGPPMVYDVGKLDHIELPLREVFE